MSELSIGRSDAFDAVATGRAENFLRLTEGSVSLEEALFLYGLARAVEHGCIVEVGSYRGRSTVALGRGSLDGHQAPVYAIDPHEEFTGVLGGRFGPTDRGAFYKAMLDSGCYHVVRLVNLSSEQITPSWGQPVSLLWIDGDHRYESVRRDFEVWQPQLSKDCVVVFDDTLDQTIGPYRLIKELVASGKYRRIAQVGKMAVLKAAAGLLPPAPGRAIH